MLKKIKYHIDLMRPKHYLKNVLIFVPLVFSGLLLTPDSLIKTIIGFIDFSIVASTIYIINDLKDIEKDKRHPKKKNRPLASGKISINEALCQILIMLIILILSLLIFPISIISMALLLGYFLLNIGYSFGLKNIPILDVFIIVLGFLIRIIFGANLIQVRVSKWLYLTIITISFFLSLGKRRNEILIQNKEKDTREVLKYYNKEFIDKNMYMNLGMAIVFYSLWATDELIVLRISENLIWTIPLIIVICMKYSLDLETGGDGDPTNVILEDKILLGLIFILGAFISFLIYFK